MSENLAIVTTCGKAYYQLVSECKRREIPFLSLIPGKPIPLNVKVAITTNSERQNVSCPNVLSYHPSEEPSKIVDQAFQLLYGKGMYEEMVIGIDPGKVFGVALLGDGIILRTDEYTSAGKTAERVSEHVSSIKADRKIVKIGDGAPRYRSIILEVLDENLPPSVEMMSVEERGTTRDAEKISYMRRRGVNALSAVKISMRIGRHLMRKKLVEE